MWCSTCQQDVPGLGSAQTGRRCGKCQQPLADEAASPCFKQADLVRLLDDLPADDWALDAELRGVERMVSALRATPHSPPTHTAHTTPGPWHVPNEPPRTAPAAAAESTSPPLLAWTILSLGLALFACGGVLLGWSVVAGRDDLWSLGVPLALLGQAGLILGLLLQLDGLWHSSRQAARTLTQLDGELASVRHATTLLSTSKSTSAQSFYVHLAEGASPQLLLADVKGQLDLLAQQMATQRR